MSIFGSIVKAAVKYNPVTLSTRAALGAAKAIPIVNRVASPVSRLVDAVTLNKSTAPRTTAATYRPLPATARPTSSATSSGTSGVPAGSIAAGQSFRATTAAPRDTTVTQIGARTTPPNDGLLSRVASAMSPSNPVVSSSTSSTVPQPPPDPYGASGVTHQNLATDSTAGSYGAPSGGGGGGGGGGGYSGPAADLQAALDASAAAPQGYYSHQSFNDPSAGAMPFSYGGADSDDGGAASFDVDGGDEVPLSRGSDGVDIPDHMYESSATEEGDDSGNAGMYLEGLFDDIKSGAASFGKDVAKEGAQRLLEGTAKKLDKKGKSSPKPEYEVKDKPMSTGKKLVIGAALTVPALILGQKLIGGHHHVAHNPRRRRR